LYSFDVNAVLSTVLAVRAVDREEQTSRARIPHYSRAHVRRLDFAVHRRYERTRHGIAVSLPELAPPRRPLRRVVAKRAAAVRPRSRRTRGDVVRFTFQCSRVTLRIDEVLNGERTAGGHLVVTESEGARCSFPVRLRHDHRAEELETAAVRPLLSLFLARFRS
jgi:hypothetical protein